MSAVIILEDNNDKIRYILDHNGGFHSENVVIVRSVQAAKYFTQNPGVGKLRFFLDYELAPGCGSGFEFLEWAIATIKNKIIDVTVITFRTPWRNEMMLLCEKNGIKVEAFENPFSATDSAQMPVVKP